VKAAVGPKHFRAQRKLVGALAGWSREAKEIPPIGVGCISVELALNTTLPGIKTAMPAYTQML
jgi:hypothetical protein